jgi:amino acid permease
MDILLFSILTNFLYFCSGSIFIKKIKEDFHSQFKVYILGVIFVSFISLLLNFFTALNPNVNSIIYLIIFFAFIIKKKIILNKQHLIFLLVSSLITFLLLIYSNVNRPDAGLYHLPYISIINENKIIFGLSNIHFRFGHISILQYLWR